jgi:hypothetical protein
VKSNKLSANSGKELKYECVVKNLESPVKTEKIIEVDVKKEVIKKEVIEEKVSKTP